MAVTKTAGLKGLSKTATRPKKKAPQRRADVPNKDNPYLGCGPGKIRDPANGECVSYNVYNKKYKTNKHG